MIEIGLQLENEDWEYPLWILLKKDYQSAPFHVVVNNKSEKLMSRSDPPDWIISTMKTPNTKIDGQEYQEFWKSAVARILNKKK